jgi:hypothetical protein
VMENLKTKSACVIDNGAFLETAVMLAREFGKVYYVTPWVNAFPRSNDVMIGKGIPGITRIDSVWDVIDDVDLFVFPDVGDGPLQVHLRSIGKRVWGSGMGEELEFFREKTKKLLPKLGLHVGEWTGIEGIDSLRSFLKNNPEQWVKVDRFRGDFETFKSPTYPEIETRIDEIEQILGIKKHTTRFVVEKDIPDAVEIAFDGYTVDGMFPKNCVCGIEIKDAGYVGKYIPYAKVPEPLQEINTKLSPILKGYEYRNFFACEARITKDHKAWVIDPCCRASSPPGDLLLNMYTNLPQVFWQGAEGTLVEPEVAGKWCAELLIHFGGDGKAWRAVEFPEKIRDHIKLRSPSRIKGRYYMVPQVTGPQMVGAACGIGSTMKEAIEQAKEYAAQVKGYLFASEPSSLDHAAEELKKLEGLGLGI